MTWIFLIFSLFGVATCSNYSYPRILIIGATGVGKSSLGNVLAGCTPSNESCFFPICHGSDSCTKETTIAEATFLGQLAGPNTAILDGNVTLIDSPGFGDSDLDGPTLIAEMIEVLKNNLGEANTILLCFKNGRFSEGIQKMIEELESIFGRERLWNNVILEITFWAYDEKSIKDRKRQNITEAGTLADINRQLQEHFHLNHSLPGVFIDSYAVYYIDEDTEDYDEVQKQYFLNYSLTLWEAANAMEPFPFYTIEDILNQLHTCQIENDCLNEVLEERITNIENNVNNINSTITNDIIELTNDIADNAQCIDDLVVTDSNLNDRMDHFNITVTNNIIELTNNVADNAQCIDDLVVTDSNFNNRMDHFNITITNDIIELTNDVADNQKLIQKNKLHIDNNMDKTDINTHNIDNNTQNIDSNTNKIGTNTHNIDSNANKIGTNTHNIDSNANKIGTNTRNIDSNANQIDSNTNKIDSNTDKIDSNTGNIATNKKTIDTLTETTSRFVSYCGYRDYTDRYFTGILTYDRLVTSINSFSTGGLDITTGEFTSPTPGTYLVNTNFWTSGAGYFWVYINKNGNNLNEGVSVSKSVDDDRDQTGRTLTIQLETNDKLYLHVTTNYGTIYYSTFCITLIK